MAKWILMALFVPLAAQAEIDVFSMDAVATSSGQEAADLMKSLKEAGLPSFKDASGNETLSANGQMTTVSATCDTDKYTYDITLNALDGSGGLVKSFGLDTNGSCEGKTNQAETFYDLMMKWGGSTVAADCGMSHCRQLIKSIECTRYSNNQSLSCSVEITSGDQN